MTPKSDRQIYRDAVNNVLESGIAMVEQLRVLEPYWDVLSEEKQTQILIGLDTIESIHTTMHMAIQAVGDTAQPSAVAANELLRRL